ncbi:MAG: S-layer homology domain-containing protein, partial [Bacillota bacterium]
MQPRWAWMQRRWSRAGRAALAGVLTLGLLLSAVPALAETGPTEAVSASEENPGAENPEAPVSAPAAPVPPDAPAAPRPLPEPIPDKEGSRPLGQVAVSRDAAVARARELLPIPEDLGEPAAHLSQSSEPGSRPEWYLEWSSTPEEEPQIRYTAVVDATTGEIRHYAFDRWGGEESRALTYTRREARQRAEEWLRKLAGPYLSEFRLDEQNSRSYFGPGSTPVHIFSWRRLAAGYPVPYQGVTIGIDARTGELTHYNLSWDRETAFDPPEKTVDPAQAAAAFWAAVRLGLAYRQFWDPATQKDLWKLVYAPVAELPLVDAATGEALDSMGRPFAPVAWEDLRPLPPAQPYNPPAEPLTHEQALALAKSAVGTAAAPTQVNYRETSQPVPGKYYHFMWYPQGPEAKEGEWHYDVEVDAVRGVVQRMYTWTRRPENWQETPPAVDWEKARAAADAFLREFRPDLVPHLRELPDANETRWCRMPGPAEGEEARLPVCNGYQFSYILLHGGIPALGRTVSVEVDPWSGKVTGFWASPDLPEAEELPRAEGVIGREAALEKLLSQTALELRWAVQPPVVLPAAGKGGDARPKARLVYGLAVPDESAGVVDAFTGELLDSRGRPLTRRVLEPADVAGHPAQKEIELLLLRGVLEVEADGKFHPDRPVTRAEAAQWLVLARGLQPYVPPRGQYSFAEFQAGDAALSPDRQAQARFAEAALRAGILVKEEMGEAFEPDRLVTREEFALWAVRAMGYGA